MPEDDKTQVSRREAFVKLGVGSVAVACAGAAVFGYEFLSPNVLYEPSPIANAGKPDRYPRGSVTQDLQAGIYIVHGPEGFYALSAICTHLGCLTAWNAGAGHHRLPVPRQQVQRAGSEDRRPRAARPALAEGVAER